MTGEAEQVALSFDPGAYAEIRRRGSEVFRSFVDRLEAEDRLTDRYLRERIPSQDFDPLPLRTLAGFGASLDSGDLFQFTMEPIEDPVGNGYLSWWKGYGDDFARLFPEQQNSNLPSRGDWVKTGPSELWGVLGLTSMWFARAAGRPHDCAACFFVLLRDHADELGPLAQSLGLELDPLTRSAFELDAGGGSIEDVRKLYVEIRNRNDIRHGPELAFVAFVLHGGLDLTLDLGERWDRKALFDAAHAVAREAQEVSALGVKPEALRDLPSGEDRIGVEPLVRGMRALLDSEDTRLPLAIGVNAPWGGGKSSLMLQLRKALVEYEVSNREWIPIGFDAWKFERSERLWAALAKAMYEQAQDSWTLRRWTWFKLRLELRRRGRLDLGIRLALFSAFLAIGVTATLMSGVGLPAIAGFALSAAAIGDTLIRAWGLIGDPFKRAIDSYAAKYDQQLGFTSEADADIQAMTAELTREPGQAVVVFVNDLDRCSPRHIVDVVEAINQIFNSNPEAECAFVLGMDREVVAAGIEVAYEDMIARLPPERRRNFGLSFLAKLVQISVTVPSPRRDVIENLMEAEPTVESSVDIWSAEGTLLQYLDLNPREIKRFRNAFRLQLHVANRADGHDLSFDRGDLIMLGKWVVLRFCWPDLCAAIDRDPELLRRLEEACFDGGEGEGLSEQEAEWLRGDEKLISFLEGTPQLSGIDWKAALRVS